VSGASILIKATKDLRTASRVANDAALPARADVEKVDLLTGDQIIFAQLAPMANVIKIDVDAMSWAFYREWRRRSNVGNAKH
jgi:hypothetical protein